jgi:streptogramin lyase
VVTEYPVTLPHAFNSGAITTGPDGALWFTANSGFFNPRKIGRVDTAGNTVSYDLYWSGKCCAGPDSGPYGIAAGADGTLWFTAGRDIARITTNGAAQLMASSGPGFFANGMIAAGPDGNLWFVDSEGNQIYRTTGGSTAGFPIPTANSGPHGIAAGPDGNLWFTERAGNKIGRITPTGVITEFPLPTANASPTDIARGPDGAMWFTENVGTTTPPDLTAVSPSSGPAAGGTPITLTGSGFIAGAQVFVGDTAAADVLVVDPATITATVPAFQAGILWDVVVTNPDTGSGAIPHGWFADFYDVPGSHLYHGAVEKILRADITTGCGGGNYCPQDPIDRSAMAKFILRAKHGITYFPRPPPSYYLPDVDSTNNILYTWVYAFFAEGISTGCGGGRYCPSDPVTRDAMAVFLLRGKHGSSFTPPAASGTLFGDVQADTYLAKWIEQLKAEGITQGCGGGNYCPGNAVTRGEMAPFLVRAFGL